MRRRIFRTLLAVAAAGATAATLGFAAAGAASASPVINPPSGGTPIYTNTNCSGSATCAIAGYQASGRDFRYAQAVIAVPTSNGSTATSPELYVGLHDGNLSHARYPNAWAHAGIEPCTIGGGCPNGWQGFYEVFQDGSPLITVHVPFNGVAAGDGVFFSIYFNSVGNADRFVVTLPDGSTAGQTVAVNGPVYTSAVASADWGFTTAPDPEPAVPAANIRVTQFFQGRFTTLSGQQGTFRGPWSLNPVEATTNGFAPPGGTLVAAPAYLWTDGNSFQGRSGGNSVRGRSGDAFGAWLYGNGVTPTPTPTFTGCIAC